MKYLHEAAFGRPVWFWMLMGVGMCLMGLLQGISAPSGVAMALLVILWVEGWFAPKRRRE